MAKLPEPPAIAAMRGITPDVEMLPAGTRLYRIYFRGGRHPGGWDRFRNFGPLPNARFDHHFEPPRVQERAILYAATRDDAVATCVAEVFQETRLVDTRRRNPQLAATYRAIETVFFAIPQEAGAEVWFRMKAIERNLLSIDDLDAAAARLGLDAEELLAEPHSYVDRFGEYKAPFGVAVKVAKHCCERFAREVLRYLQAEEEEIRQELVSGNRDVSRTWWTDNEAYRERAEARLEESRPVFAIVREWCGREAVEEFHEVLMHSQ